MIQASMDEKIRTIEEYIYARRGVRVKINHPDTDERWALFLRAYLIAKAWLEITNRSEEDVR